MSPKSDVILSLEAPFRGAVDIHRLRFGEPGSGPHVAIVAGLHGNEVGGCGAVQSNLSFARRGRCGGPVCWAIARRAWTGAVFERADGQAPLPQPASLDILLLGAWVCAPAVGRDVVAL